MPIWQTRFITTVSFWNWTWGIEQSYKVYLHIFWCLSHYIVVLCIYPTYSFIWSITSQLSISNLSVKLRKVPINVTKQFYDFIIQVCLDYIKQPVIINFVDSGLQWLAEISVCKLCRIYASISFHKLVNFNTYLVKI